jgi:hypothetical protein
MARLKFSTQYKRMNHGFVSRMADVRRATKGMSIASDVVCILNMSMGDHAMLIQRKDELIKDESARRAILRNGKDGLQNMLLKIDQCTLNTTLSADHGREWKVFLWVGTPVSKSLHTRLEHANRLLRKLRDDGRRFEQDTGSSSSSDDDGV